MEKKEPIKIEFSPGCTIEKAVNQLLEFKDKGLLAYGKFNGVTLRSDTVTMDDAYEAITGMTKMEFDDEIQRKAVEKSKRRMKYGTYRLSMYLDFEEEPRIVLHAGTWLEVKMAYVLLSKLCHESKKWKLEQSIEGAWERMDLNAICTC